MIRAAVATAAVLVASSAAAAEPPCRLELSEQRSGMVLVRVPLPPLPQFAIEFEHSVLGHTVTDRYQLRGQRAHLFEERFAGEGYGLPHAPGPGERLRRDGDGWTLELDRVVDPLVVRPLRDQRTRLRIGERELLLADLTDRPILIRALGCDRS